MIVLNNNLEQNNMEINTIKAKKVVQNNQNFLISVIEVRTLKRYTKYTERIIFDFDENDKPIYNDEIQRKTDKGKVNSIANYLLNDPEAMFPTNIVLAVPNIVINDYQESNGEVVITLSEDVENGLRINGGDILISVIDGQHRLKGLELAIKKVKYDLENPEINFTDETIKVLESKLDKLMSFQVPVTFFINPVLDYQANIFSIINRTQTKVSESLVYSLFGLSDKSSPQKTALEVSLTLNGHKTSPFRGKIKLVGNQYKDGYTPSLTQAGVIKSIIKCISPSMRSADSERFLPRKSFVKGITPELCFRRYYSEDRDTDITKILYAFFKAVELTFVTDDRGISLWRTDDIPNIINSTVGFESLLEILKILLAQMKINDVFNIDEYQNYLIKAKGLLFTDLDKYRKTSSTKRILIDDLRNEIGI